VKLKSTGCSALKLMLADMLLDSWVRFNQEFALSFEGSG